MDSWVLFGNSHHTADSHRQFVDLQRSRRFPEELQLFGRRLTPRFAAAMIEVLRPIQDDELRHCFVCLKVGWRIRFNLDPSLQRGLTSLVEMDNVTSQVLLGSGGRQISVRSRAPTF